MKFMSFALAFPQKGYHLDCSVSRCSLNRTHLEPAPGLPNEVHHRNQGG